MVVGKKSPCYGVGKKKTPCYGGGKKKNHRGGGKTFITSRSF